MLGYPKNDAVKEEHPKKNVFGLGPVSRLNTYGTIKPQFFTQLDRNVVGCLLCLETIVLNQKLLRMQ